MNYTLNQLQVFLKIVQCKSVTRAAEELHLTQPAVSIQLKNFQDQFDIPLTEVVGRKIYITDFGMEIAQAAERIINEVHAINYKTLAFKGQLFGKLRISVVSTGKYIMPFFLSTFMKKHPGLELEMDVTNKSSVIESLEKNEVDFALVSILPKSLQVEKLDLLQNKLFLVGSPEGGLKPKNIAESKSIFADLPFIFRENGSGTRQAMEQYFQQNQISVRPSMELTSNEAVKQAILAGLGYSIMPLIGIKNELFNHELSIIPVPGLPTVTTWSLIWLNGKNHSPAAKQYLSYLKSEKQNIVQQQFNWYENY
jgi:DNA-binding transcriptional LysR family regulator